jgi:formylglycine-generating enzyme required for sulfatase activity
MEAPSGSLVAFATAPGSTADENRGGRNGLYTQYLLQAIETPGLRLEDVFQQVRREVERASSRKQSPEEISKLTSAFYFRRPEPQSLANAAPAPGTLDGATAQFFAQRAPDPEVDLWDLAKRRDNAGTYEAYLRAYPQGRYAVAARAALDGMRATLASATPSVVPSVTAPAPLTLSITSVHASEAPLAPSSTAAMRDGEVFKDCADCPEMVVVSAGRFLMGSPERRFLKAGEAGRSDDEGPQRWVDVQRFAIGKFEVTQRQWESVMGSNPSRFKDCGPDCPVERVSWNDTQEFLRRLSQRTGQLYRLPSEAEWEYAARAGTANAYPWGEQISRDYANYGADTCCAERAEGRDRWLETAPVGQFPANAFGLHDMHGNLWEWVQDVWHYSYAGAPSDGSPWMSGGDQSLRVLRGGSWLNSPQDLRSANRDWYASDFRGVITGFRIARAL